MDAFDEEQPIELGKDALKAARIYSLALVFSNLGSPLTTTAVLAEFYPDSPREAAERMFRRDRETLASLGIVLRSVDDGSSHMRCWELDEEASLAGSERLCARDALALDVLCRPLVSDPDFPYADELGMALAKIDRSFAGTLPGHSPRWSRGGRLLKTVRSCLEEGCAVRVSYVDASGRASTRVLAPYGLFGLRGHTYLVAARLDDGTDSHPVSQPSDTSLAVHDYRLDRMESADALASVHVSVPDDFEMDDCVRLPFQIGPVTCKATFEVPEARLRDVLHDSLGKGTWSEDHTRWTVDVSDQRCAASWSVAEGIVPSHSSPLFGLWRDVLEGVHDGTTD